MFCTFIKFSKYLTICQHLPRCCWKLFNCSTELLLFFYYTVRQFFCICQNQTSNVRYFQIFKEFRSWVFKCFACDFQKKNGYLTFKSTRKRRGGTRSIQSAYVNFSTTGEQFTRSLQQKACIHHNIKRIKFLLACAGNTSIIDLNNPKFLSKIIQQLQ